MKHRILSYLNYIDEILSDKSERDWDETISNHIEQIRFFQHERIVHLIVFSLVAICTVICILFYVTYEVIVILPLILLLLILLVPYCMHYYLLENSVQKMYDQYDKMVAKKQQYFDIKQYNKKTNKKI